MKKLYSVLILLSFGVFHVCRLEAAPIDTTAAKNIAIQYARLKEGGVTRTNQQLHIVCKVKSPFLAETPDEESRTPIGPKGGNPNASEEEKVCYYVINMDPAGFVIVSADNRATPILAYSATDHFDANAMPDGMRALLNGFVEEIRALTPDDTALPAVQQKWQELASGTATPKSGNTVGPLIQTHWGQSSEDIKLMCILPNNWRNCPFHDPSRATYNKFCPGDENENAPNQHAYVGCAAVALAQLIRYWEYPYIGKGSYLHKANFSDEGYGDYGDLPLVDFGSTYYNYDLMPAQISIESPEGQINAVAQLLYHCGVATEMMYGPRGSNTPGPKMQTALTLYFRYPSGGERIFKANYDNETWSNIVKAELDAGRPILYEAADVSSSGKDNGHGFICDGYNSDDFFHFNWGWRGDYDNVWYPLSAMTPSIYTYNSKHGAYIGIGQGLEREKPTVATEMISCSSQSMTVKGILLRKGESNVTETGFVYGTSTGPTISNATKIPVARDYNQTFSYAITNVQPNTTYYVRAYATNEHGTMYGEEIIAFPSDHITVIFHKNDGTQETATQQYPPFGYHALSHDFTRPGHTLRVWNTAADGSGRSYSNGDWFYSIGGFNTSQIDLYAIWNNASCTVASTTGNDSTITAVSDHQGNSYGVVQIGSQCWMSENLRCTTTPSGTNLFINSSFNMIQNPVMAYYFLDNPDNDKFGLLYTWYAACDATNPEANNSSTRQGICPEGWHLPTAGSDGDWGELTKTLKLPENSSLYRCGFSANNIAKSLASVNSWYWSQVNCAIGNSSEDNNTSGFNLIPMGGRFGNDGYKNAKEKAFLWSATGKNTEKAYVVTLNRDGATFQMGSENKTNAFPVRCVRDAETTPPSPGSTTSCEVSSIRTNETGSDGTITAVRDHQNNSYAVVQIGSQCWLKENMRCTTSPSTGTNMVYNENETSSTERRAYYYNDIPANAANGYGLLYNWPAAMDGTTAEGSRGICPQGWHLPTDAEWITLMNTAVNTYQPGVTPVPAFGSALESQNGFAIEGQNTSIVQMLSDNRDETWAYLISLLESRYQAGYVQPEVYNGYMSSFTGPLCNITGFQALPSFGGPDFQSPIAPVFWTSLMYAEDKAWGWGWYDDICYEGVAHFNTGKAAGLSVRCLRNENGEEAITVPSVSTSMVTNITATSALCGGSVISNGGDNVITQGVCWSTTSPPTIADNILVDINNTQQYSVLISALAANTTYYVRAYSTNSKGTGYGNVVSFTTTAVMADGEPCPNAPSLTDYDGNVYNTVHIGYQCWMKENLRTTHFADGSAIPLGLTYSLTDPYRYAPNNDENTVSQYGYLYNWPATMHGEASSGENPSGVQGVCPIGWHVPSSAEWTQLIDYVGSHVQYVCGHGFGAWGFDVPYIAKSLAASSGWPTSTELCNIGNDYTANNKTGFSALPAGSYSVNNNYENNYSEFNNVATWWTSTFYYANMSHCADIHAGYADIGVVNAGHFRGHSIRCLQNSENGDTPTPPSPGSTTSCGVSSIQTNETGSNGIISAVRDHQNNSYAVVQIGSQCWLKENMRCTTSPNTGANMVENPAVSDNMSSTERRAYYYDNDPANAADGYGLLYNWSAAMDGSTVEGSRGICPEGWHLPTDAEWTTLTDYLSSQSEYICGENPNFIAKAMTTSTGWIDDEFTEYDACDVYNDQSTNNASGFSAVPAGIITPSLYYNAGFWTYFWSSTETSINKAWIRELEFSAANVWRSNIVKIVGHSVRCLRDAAIPESNAAADSLTGENVPENHTNTQEVSKSSTDQEEISNLNACMVYTPLLNETTASQLTTANYDVITEVRDHQNNTYPVVQIGSQCWLRQNMRCTTSPTTGTYLVDNADNLSYAGKKAYLYDNASANNGYGLLYNWNAAVDTFNSAYAETGTSTLASTAVDALPMGIRRGICPDGWHIPSANEWTELNQFVSSQPDFWCDYNDESTAKPLASATGWSVNGTLSACDAAYDTATNNATGFSALPAGWCIGGIQDRGTLAAFTSLNGSLAFGITADENALWSDTVEKSYGLAVRCVRNTLPSVVTKAVSTLTFYETLASGEVLSEGDAPILERGVVCRNENGSIVSQASSGSGLGIFVGALTDLQPDADYEVRAYATNSYGTAYGDWVAFHTPCLSFYSEETQITCDNYLWGDTLITQSGTYTRTFASQTGCDSTVQLSLYILESNVFDTTIHACGSYLYRDSLYTHSQVIHDSTSEFGSCTLYNNINLLVQETYTVTTDTAVDTYIWYGQEYTESGTYWHQYTTDEGCVVTDTLHLTIHYGTHNVVNETACESFTWHGQTYTASGTYTYAYSNTNGCSSTDTLHLIINNPIHLSYFETAFDTYTWTNGNGETYTQSGTYYYTHSDANNCTQVDTLFLTVYYSSTNEFSATACESYEWDGQVYTESGDYTRNYLNIHGADSTVILHLTVHYGTHNVESQIACESFTWHGQNYTTSGTYTYDYINANGCSSTDTLHLTVHYGTHNVVNETDCESFTWHGQTYTSSGTYTYAYSNTNGCSSTDTLHLTINNPIHLSYFETAFDTYTWTNGNSETYTQSGTYYYTHSDANNCTQVDTLFLTVYYSSTNEFSATACESYEWDGQVYTESGDYTRNYLNIHGADSTVILHLTVHYGTHNVESQIACESCTWHGQTYTTSGTYTYAYTNANGCSSTDTLHLTVHYGTHNVVNETACEAFTWHGQNYTTSGTYTYAYTNANGCSSTDTLHLTVNYGTHNVESQTACESFTWHEQTYTTSGTFTYAYSNADGCESVDTLHLTVNHGTHNVETVTACETFTWHGQTYTTSGTYTYAYTNANGCSSTDTLHLTVHYGTHNVINETACEAFTWHGQTYTTSGTYTYAYTNANGCSSTDTLHLTVHYGTHNVESQIACESFTWHGQTYTTSGTYTYAYTNANGCSSTDTLHLTVHYGTHNVVNETACEAFTWHGQTHTTSGTYTYDYTNAYGCSSTDTLHLTVSTPPEMTAITGEPLICKNQFETYYYSITNPNFQYRWYKNNVLITENQAHVTLHEQYGGPVYLKMQATDNQQICQADTSLLIQVSENYAPDTTTVRRKGTSNILLCQEVSSPYGTVHYRWGYTDRLNGAETILNGDQTYCLYTIGIDTFAYSYWVETYLDYTDGSSCANRSYYGNGYLTATEDFDGNTVEAYLSNEHIHLFVNALEPGAVTATLYDASGKRLLTRNYGLTDHVTDILPASYANGVYVLRVSVGHQMHSFKMVIF